MVEDKIFDNNYDSVDYGAERNSQMPIAIDPMVSDQYKESTSENMESLYTERNLRNLMSALYETSPFFEKYKQNVKKVERADMNEIYYYFKKKLVEKNEYNLVQILCAIAEFFEMNYKTLYNDVISLEDKVEILETLEDSYGLESQFAKSKKLF